MAGSPRGLKLSAVSALLLFAACLIVGGTTYYRHDQLKHEGLENVTWAIYQLDRQSREVQVALEQLQLARQLFLLSGHGGAKAQSKRLLERFDILYGRVKLLQQGQYLEHLRNHQEVVEALWHIDTLIQDIDAVLAPSYDGDAELTDGQVAKLAPWVDRLRADAEVMLLDHNKALGSVREKARADMLRVYSLFFGLVMLIMLAGTYLVVALWREARSRARQSERLQRQSIKLRDAMHEAQEASQAKSEFMAIMSHEIRTPLNGVVGMIDVLEDESSPELRQQQFSTLKESTSALRAVINDVLDYSKIEAGRLELEATPFSLTRMLSTLAEGYRSRESSDVRLVRQFCPTLPHVVVGDATRLRQVLMNLLDNAFKFTLKGSVTLSAQPQDEHSILFEVRDTGVGIPKDRQETLFEPFTQLDTSLSRRHEGTGLGLAICRRLVEAMGGQLELDSMPGLGSRFRVCLPLPIAEGLSEQQLEDPAADLPHRHILVVEDNPINRDLAAALLKRLGQSVELACNGSEGLRAMKAGRCDIVLMDMQMPEMDGLETTRRYRKEEAGRHLPIIAMTANVMPEHRQACLESGMDAILSKPFTRLELANLLRTYPPSKQQAERQREQCSLEQLVEGARSPSSGEECIRGDGNDYLDKDTVAELKESLDSDTLQVLLRAFFDRLDSRMASLQQALLDNDDRRLEREAHSLKGAAGAMACSALASAAKRLESGARQSQKALMADEVAGLPRLTMASASAWCEQGIQLEQSH